MTNYLIAENDKSPNGAYEVIYCFQEEYGHGGPYVAAIYLAQKEKPPMYIHYKCFGHVKWANDSSCFYFMMLNGDRKLQVMQFIIATNELKLFLDVYDFGTFESVSLHGYKVNVKNWLPAINNYNEGLVICDSNPENVESQEFITQKIRIEPKYGIEIINMGDHRDLVRSRVAGYETFEGDAKDYYTKWGFHVHYDAKNEVEAIEIMFDMAGVFELYGFNPAREGVEKVVEVLTQKNNGETNPIEEPQSYMFLELSLGIFRNSTPEKFAKYMEQTKAENPADFENGTPEWMLQDLEKTKHFQTLLIGNKDYFRNPIYFQK